MIPPLSGRDPCPCAIVQWSYPCIPFRFRGWSVHLACAVFVRVTLKMNHCPKQDEGILVALLSLGICSIKTHHSDMPMARPSRVLWLLTKQPFMISLILRFQCPISMQPYSGKLYIPPTGHDSKFHRMKLANLTWLSSLLRAHLLFNSA